MTLTREPSGSRASTSGSASSTRRPSGARMRSIACRRSASVSNATPASSIRPARSTNTEPGPLTMTSSTVGSRSSGSSGAEAEGPLDDAAHEVLARLGVQHPGLALHERADAGVEITVLPGARLPYEPLAQRGGKTFQFVAHTTGRPPGGDLRPRRAASGRVGSTAGWRCGVESGRAASRGASSGQRGPAVVRAVGPRGRAPSSAGRDDVRAVRESGFGRQGLNGWTHRPGVDAGRAAWFLSTLWLPRRAPRRSVVVVVLVVDAVDDRRRRRCRRSSQSCRRTRSRKGCSSRSRRPTSCGDSCR